MLFTLAIIPAVILLIYIYKKDRKEKEPMGLLISCFILGIIIIIPAVIMETVIESVFDSFLIPGSVLYAAAEGFLVAAFSEELCKYLAMKLRTWNSKEFNCSFDGIVYAVFVSLGFAAFENVMYVMDGDLSTALIRMVTAVPGHAYDAVFMGVFYSKAKQAHLRNDRKTERSNKRMALLIPILFHGFYDFLISIDSEVAGEAASTIGVYLWFAFVIFEFVLALNVVRSASMRDTYFYQPETPLGSPEVWEYAPVQNLEHPVNAVVQNPEHPTADSIWICKCGSRNNGNYCPECGAHRP